MDEAHRSREGDLGRKMRESLPNAFLFGLTGTPINRADRNTKRLVQAAPTPRTRTRYQAGGGMPDWKTLDESLRDIRASAAKCQT